MFLLPALAIIFIEFLTMSLCGLWLVFNTTVLLRKKTLSSTHAIRNSCTKTSVDDTDKNCLYFISLSSIFS